MARLAPCNLVDLVHNHGRLGLDGRGHLDLLNALDSPVEVGQSLPGLRLQKSPMIFEKMVALMCL
jgi:uncharacterized protein (DUF1778 family)